MGVNPNRRCASNGCGGSRRYLAQRRKLTMKGKQTLEAHETTEVQWRIVAAADAESKEKIKWQSRTNGRTRCFGFATSVRCRLKLLLPAEQRSSSRDHERGGCGVWGEIIANVVKTIEKENTLPKRVRQSAIVKGQRSSTGLQNNEQVRPKKKMSGERIHRWTGPWWTGQTASRLAGGQAGC